MTTGELITELSALPREERIARLRTEVARLDLSERFEVLHALEIYRHPDTHSGSGSTHQETAALRAALPDLFHRLGVRTVLDLPCGDFHWMSKVDLSGVEYTGCDIVQDLIDENRRRYEAASEAGDGRRFLLLDGTRDELPRVDLILCRDLVIHLGHDDVFRLLRNFVASGSRWLLITHFLDCTDNAAIESGDFRPVNLRRPPFSLPTPREILSEESRMDGWSDRAMALWHLDEVAAALGPPSPDQP